jgi:hypothetical protein
VVYYRNQLQRRLQNMEEWRYFDRYQTPVHRVTLQGLDYALIYRNPIQHHVPSQNIGQPNTLNLFGYNLAADGDLTLFWQNPGLAEEQELWAGLAPAGIENTGQDTHWWNDTREWVLFGQGRGAYRFLPSAPGSGRQWGHSIH